MLARKSDLAKELASKPLGNLRPSAHRRFIVPKDDISYRQATQLHPQDTIVLSAILYEYGARIEERRLERDTVFSYRFSPTSQHGLYGIQSSWNDFWNTARLRGAKSGRILYCDISDFYNQIAHHTIENQLIESRFPNQATKWIISLLETTTAGVSRGIPIGPHAAHLLAEASLIPIDNSMASSDFNFIRYADDIVVFCSNEQAAKRSLGRLAGILDKQQRLILQRHKTRLFVPDEFIPYCLKMIEDRPINPEEDRMLKIVQKYSGGDPYKTISFNDIKQRDWAKISDRTINKIVTEYINQDQVDYIRLRWFYRRLAQIGHPGAIAVTLSSIDRLMPCFASICAYFSSIQSIDKKEWLEIGSKLLDLLDREEIRESEYFKLSILSLFSRNPFINHFAKLAKLYQGSDPFTKREIFLSAKASKMIDWLREFKEDFHGMDQWQKMSFLYCLRDFPKDEKRYFINRWEFEQPVEAIIAKWAKAE